MITRSPTEAPAIPEQTRHERKLVDLVKSRYEHAVAKAPVQEWETNLNFYEGNQWLAWNPRTNQHEEPAAPSWRVRLVANHVLAGVIRLHAKLTQRQPDVQVQPISPEPSATSSAKAKTRLLKHLWRELNMDSHTDHLAKWLVICGNAYTKTHWNPASGPQLPDEPTLQIGQVAVEVLSPFDLMPDPSARTLNEAQWVIQAHNRSSDWVYARYGLDIRKKTARPRRKLFGRTQSDHQGSNKTVFVAEMWERPTPEHPLGRVITVVHDTLVSERPFPFDVIDFPFVHFKYINVPGKFWGRGAVTDIVPLQKQYNRGRSQVMETRNLHGRPQMLIPDGSVNPATITTAPGLMIRYNPQFGKPERVPPPEIPQYIEDDLDRTLRDIDRILGVGEISRAEIPDDFPSGHAIALLMEQENMRFIPVIHRYERSIAATAEKMLQLAKQHYTEPRRIHIEGEHHQIISQELHPRDLQGFYNVVVRPGSAVPESQAAQQAQILDLWKEDVLTEREQVLQLLSFSNLDRVYNDIQIDTAHAQREHLALSQGDTVPVADWHNHAIHIRIHNNFRKTPDYEALPPHIKRNFEAHIAAHQEHVTTNNQSLSELDEPTDSSLNPNTDDLSSKEDSPRA